MPKKTHALTGISKGNLTVTKEEGKGFSHEIIKLSAIVRLADGLDKIGSGIEKLSIRVHDAEFERDCWRDKYRELMKKYKARGYEIAALKTSITKAKNNA